jgi:hypothetical protein
MAKHDDTESVLVVHEDADATAVAVDDAAPVAEEVAVAPSADAPPVAAMVAAHEGVSEKSPHDMPSLYDTKSTTVVAVFLCVGIIVAVQFIIERIFKEAKDIHYALTRFVVSMVALLVGAYICDLVVSGPDTSLLADSEKASILDFVKSTALMIFSYFFGVKSAGAAPASSSED